MTTMYYFMTRSNTRKQSYLPQSHHIFNYFYCQTKKKSCQKAINFTILLLFPLIIRVLKNKQYDDADVDVCSSLHFFIATAHLLMTSIIINNSTNSKVNHLMSYHWTSVEWHDATMTMAMLIHEIVCACAVCYFYHELLLLDSIVVIVTN